MNEDVQISHAFLAFRRPAESSKLILEFIRQIGQLTSFQYQATLDKLLEKMTEPLSTLVSLQLINGLAVCFEGEVFRLELHYQHDFDHQDQIDLTLLTLVPLQSNQLQLIFFLEVNSTTEREFREIKLLETPFLPIVLKIADNSRQIEAPEMELSKRLEKAEQDQGTGGVVKPHSQRAQPDDIVEIIDNFES